MIHASQLSIFIESVSCNNFNYPIKLSHMYSTFPIMVILIIKDFDPKYPTNKKAYESETTFNFKNMELKKPA